LIADFNLWEEEVLVMKKCKSVRGVFLSLRAVPAVAALTAGLAAGLSGCVSHVTNSSSTASDSSLYFGTGSHVGIPDSRSGGGGVWSITLDTATSYFDYNDLDSAYSTTAGNDPLNGSFTTSSDFLDLTLTAGSQKTVLSYYDGAGVGGYVVNLAGEGLLMRTGSSSVDAFGHSPSVLIGAVSSAACPAFTSAETFNFVAQGTTNFGDSVVHVAYGSVEITPGSSASWSFSNYTMYDVSGNSISTTAIPDATCSDTLEGNVLISPLPTPTDVEYVYGPLQITTGISPSGLLVIDQGQFEYGNLSNFDATATGPVGLMGVVKPSAALTVSDMVGKTYAGFESDPMSEMGTIAVVFATGSGTAITGGGFPSDDSTQKARTDTTLDLGAQSTQTPGLFTSVTLTQPDTYSFCAGTSSAGTDSNGNATCVFHGVAVAGKVGGKYVIFTNIKDPTAKSSSKSTTQTLAAINLALYQQ
jgi:hypothetical protein